MYEITRRLEFDAAHRVPLHQSKCKSLHGHRYVALVSCRAAKLTTEGFVIDFGKVKQIVGAWIDEHWDHTVIAQSGDSLMKAVRDATLEEDPSLRTWYWMDGPPTAENLARELWSIATQLLEPSGIVVSRVELFETPNCSATWPAFGAVGA
jgi:6-pyruvoyltetrahydropterin/6-carboxytetrahydropterin synthase